MVPNPSIWIWQNRVSHQICVFSTLKNIFLKKGIKRMSCSEKVIRKTHWNIRQKGQACSESQSQVGLSGPIVHLVYSNCFLQRKQKHHRLAHLCHKRQSELKSREQLSLNDRLRMEKTVCRARIPVRDKRATGENERQIEWDTVTNSPDTAHCNSQFFTTLWVASLSVSSSVSLKNAASHRWPFISHSR